MKPYEQLLVAPSLLASDPARLGAEAQRAEAAGADWLHLDIMDGHFVDNLSFGPDVVAALRPLCRLPFDVHLMVSRPDHFYPRFVKAGANSITVHLEARHEVAQTLAGIRQAGCRAGLAISPPTPLSAAEPFLDQIDTLLVMTVNPGFGGQAFLPETMEKTARAAEWRARHGREFHVEVDGGINHETARLAAGRGANVFAAGSSVFKAPDMAAAVRRLRGQE